MVEVLKTGKWTPEQALLHAQSTQDDMDHVAIVYMRKDEDVPRLIHSNMQPVDLNFLGLAVQLHSMKFIKE